MANCIHRVMEIENKPYKTGDILVVGTWPVPIFDHYAVVFYKDGVGYVAHNSFKSKNIIISGLDEFIKTRQIRKVFSTNGTLTDEYIYNKTCELNRQGKTYNFFGYNCESYVKEICSCNWGTDQRKEFSFVLIGLILVSILLYQIFKRV